MVSGRRIDELEGDSRRGRHESEGAAGEWWGGERSLGLFLSATGEI